MAMKNLLKIIKGINQNHIQAVMFLIVIFSFSIVIMLTIAMNIGSLLKMENREMVINAVALGGDRYSEHQEGFINLNGLMARMMGQRYMNDIVKLNNGQLSSVDNVRYDVSLAAAQMVKLYRAQKENGKHFLFVHTPQKIPKNEDIIPIGYDDNSNQTSDDLLLELRANGVPVLDLREKLLEDDINHSGAFFITDHHWTIETAFWAHKKILEYFADAGVISSVDAMITNIDNYVVDKRKNWFLGSSGKRTGVYYAGVDDFAIISPKFETDMTLEIPSLSVSKRGSFKEVVFTGDEEKLDYFHSNPYQGYAYGRREIKHFRNEHAPLDLKIMSIGDSFAPPAVAFLSLSLSSVDELDLNLYDGDFMEYYYEYAPDVIIVFVSTAVSLNTTYDFFNDSQE